MNCLVGEVEDGSRVDGVAHKTGLEVEVAAEAAAGVAAKGDGFAGFYILVGLNKEARNFDPDANSEYTRQYLASNPSRPAAAHNSSKSKGAKTYTIKRGDSLSRIASRNGVTVRQLCKLNGLSTKSKLKPGKKLRIR